MAHRRSQLIALRLAVLVACGAASALLAQEASSTPVAPATPVARRLLKRPGAGGPVSPEVENIRKALEALTPEQRQQFRQNFARWSTLSPEDRKTLRDQNEQRRKQMAEEIEGALKQTGLELDPQRQKAFARRYTVERRKLEEQLRQEAEVKRVPRLAEIVGRLKEEFGQASPPAAPVP